MADAVQSLEASSATKGEACHPLLWLHSLRNQCEEVGKGEDLIPLSFWEEVFSATHEEKGTECGRWPLCNSTCPVSPAVMDTISQAAMFALLV